MGGQENEEYFVLASHIWAKASVGGTERKMNEKTRFIHSFVWMHSVRSTGPS